MVVWIIAGVVAIIMVVVLLRFRGTSSLDGAPDSASALRQIAKGIAKERREEEERKKQEEAANRKAEHSQNRNRLIKLFQEGLMAFLGTAMDDLQRNVVKGKGGLIESKPLIRDFDAPAFDGFRGFRLRYAKRRTALGYQKLSDACQRDFLRLVRLLAEETPGYTETVRLWKRKGFRFQLTWARDYNKEEYDLYYWKGTYVVARLSV